MLKELIRFVLVGGLNTLIAYSMYLLFLIIMPYLAAFTLSYIISIFISYVLQTKLVFKREIVMTAAIQFPLLYISLYFFNAGLLFIFVDSLSIDQALAPILVLVITVPISFVLSRFIINRTKKDSGRIA